MRTIFFTAAIAAMTFSLSEAVPIDANSNLWVTDPVTGERVSAADLKKSSVAPKKPASPASGNPLDRNYSPRREGDIGLVEHRGKEAVVEMW